MWLKFKSFLKNPLKFYRTWRNKRKSKTPTDRTEEISIAFDNPVSVEDSKIEVISNNIDNEISLMFLEDQIEVLKKRKQELSKKEKNKYNNQLDQLLMRANARLRKLQNLTFEELDLERILAEQKKLFQNKNKFNISNESIDFSKLRKKEQILSDLNLNLLNLYLEKATPPIPKEVERELSDILAELLIDESFEAEDFVGEVEEEVTLVQEVPQIEKLSIDEDETEKIIDYLKTNGVNHFHHVTNIKNMESIEELGLFSWKALCEQRIVYFNELTKGTSQGLDDNKGKGNFVRLSFCKATPMFYARDKKYLQTNVVYKISIDCLRECIFEFSNMNATDSYVSIGSSLSFLKENFRFNLFNKYFPGLEGMDKKYYQAEILIKEHIPSKYIISKERL